MTPMEKVTVIDRHADRVRRDLQDALEVTEIWMEIVQVARATSTRLFARPGFRTGAIGKTYRMIST